MRFPEPLIEARLKRRYKRFLADVELSGGEVVTVHCANPGAMLGLAEPGAEIWLSPQNGPGRKLAYAWEFTRIGVHLVGINTARPNALVTEAIAAGRIAELAGYPDLRREVRYGENSRIDILLSGPGRPNCYVEVKNVQLMREPGLAEFPDSVTARGAKHLVELSRMAEHGLRAVMLYLVQRADCQAFALAEDIDPVYTAAFSKALASGVEALCYSCSLSLDRIAVNRALPMRRRKARKRSSRGPDKASIR
jgi:sugar fermentation stimulation protein A